MKDKSKLDETMEMKFVHHHKNNSFSRIITALLFILAGVILIGQRTGYITNDVFHMLFNWQMLLIALGIISLTKRDGSIGGIIMIMVGGVFLIPEYINLSLNTRQLLWPAILIGIGLIMLFKGYSGWHKRIERKFEKGQMTDMDVLDANHIFGGGDFHITSDNFKGGRINAIFGGGKYDFRNAKLAEGVVILEVSMIFGGLEIIVPNNWNVKVEVDSILGGFSQKSLDFLAPKSEIQGQLVIRGSAIFGGGELKRL